MQTLTQPNSLTKPFAESGDKNTLYDVNPDTATYPQRADLTNGFPQITSESIDDGGLPPERKDFNALGNLATTYNFFQQAGGVFTYDATIATAIGGYPMGARLWYDDGNGHTSILRSTKQNNTDNFITTPSFIGTSWVVDVPTLGGNNAWTGTNTFSSNIFFYKSIFAQQASNYYYFMDRTDLANNATTPTSTKYEILCNRSNNGTIVGQFLSCQDTSGNYITRMDVTSGVSGTQKTASLGVALDSSGNAFTTCPTPSSATDNSSKIATTAWVNNHLNDSTIKSKLVGYGEPDYYSGVSGLSGTALTNGWVHAKNNGLYTQADAILTISGDWGSTTFGLNGSSSIFVPISKGESYTITSGINPLGAFFPCKGG